MSKSIKDYKDAMDSIKISDSFYRRTESLLSDLSEMEIEKKPVYGGRRITALVMTAAACLACVIGVKVMVDGRQSDISTETGITEILPTEVTEYTTLSLIDDLDGGSDSMLVDEDDVIALPVDDTASAQNYDGGDIASPTSGQGGEDITAAAGGAGDAPDNENEVQAANPTAIGDGVQHSDGGGESATKNEESNENSLSNTGYPEIPDNGAENVPGLRDTAAEVITVEITPYFNMGSIKSGEGSVKMNGTECRDIIDYIAEISETSHEMGSYSFKSVFSVQISDENLGATYYSIYITDRNALIVNKHMSGGQQRATYGVKDEDYNALMRRLFTLFGNDEDYELFDTLISGK